MAACGISYRDFRIGCRRKFSCVEGVCVCVTASEKFTYNNFELSDLGMVLTNNGKEKQRSEENDKEQLFFEFGLRM